MANQPALTAQAQDVLLDLQMHADQGHHEEVKELAKKAATIFARMDTDLMDHVHRLRYGKERRQW
jgi:alkylhydroperoxidase family enzyme